MPKKVTRQKIIEAAESFLGVKFGHQGRNPAIQIDCGGHLKLVGEKVGIDLIDIEAYKFPVNSAVLLACLQMNFDEIEVKDVLPGDIYAMRFEGAKIRHVAFRVSETHLCHSLPNRGVVRERIADYKDKLVKGFRFKGV